MPAKSHPSITIPPITIPPITITVRPAPDGYLFHYGDRTIPCLVGQSGITGPGQKREGDGATPAGVWRLREVLYRPDRLTQPETPLSLSAINPDDGWCDDPASPQYNRMVRLPFDASHERMWRDDHAYNVVIPLGYNDDPPEPGLGSAIFLHCTGEGKAFTEGCIAIDQGAMLELLPRIGAGSEMIIEG